MITTWLLSNDEEPDPKQVRTTFKRAKEDIIPAEEVTRPDPDLTNKEDRAAEATQIRTASTATFANYKGTDRKNAGKGSRRTNPAKMLKDKHTGPGSILWKKIRTLNLSMPFNNQEKDSRTITKKMSLTLPELKLIKSINQEPQPFPSTIQVFSKELDGSPHPSS
jgi:hypothetical protein